MMKHFILDTIDEKKISGYKWIPKNMPKAIVQIAHGMSEHSMRYDEFAAHLATAGYAVYANDHRGHGKNAQENDELGYFAENKGWELVLQDMVSLTNQISSDYPGAPIILFGHSMGSFLSRTYLLKHSDNIKGLILSGTGGDPGILGNLGVYLARQEMKKRGQKARSELLDKLTFGSYNKKFKKTRTSYDWLSSDDKEVDKYIADPLCGGITTTSFYYDLFRGIKDLFKEEVSGNIPKNIPIYIFSGMKDPLSKNGRVVKQLQMKYKKAGVNDVSVKLYPSGRHEMLNESNKKEVYENVTLWLEETVNCQKNIKI
jgi:alpha-beta hydrolase superfamily lysophospholipase